MNTYFESSAIVKLVVEEKGSDEAGTLWDASDLVITSRLAYAEVRAAMAAARRGGRLSGKRLEAGKRALEHRFQEIDLVEVTEEVVRSAGDLAERHGIKGFDAVHLASALVVGAGSLVLVTWDRALARAGRIIGFDLGGIGAG